MATYTITPEAAAPASGTILRLAFADRADNDAIVRDAVIALAAAVQEGGEAVFLNGPASLPVAVAIAHGVSHMFGYVAVFDPKLNAYVVSVSHSPDYAPGDLIPAAAVHG